MQNLRRRAALLLVPSIVAACGRGADTVPADRSPGDRPATTAAAPAPLPQQVPADSSAPTAHPVTA
ncbi:MAG TPA: hypothetical protein VGD77_05750, partial [Gemmatimonadaceae bacterium]